MNENVIKNRLKNISKETGKSFMEIFKQLTFERFLARVADSNYRENLIFKGGLCLKQYVDSGRETKDIDFLLKKIDESLEVIQKIFKEISQIDLKDCYSFENIKIDRLEDGHKQYPGYRIKIAVKLGSMKDTLQVDLGIGDSVDEYELDLELLQYKGQSLIGEVEVSILSYPPEFIFSEKLQAIVNLKALNSRMKDYYDCFVLINENILDKEKTKDAVTATFKRRNTEVQVVEHYGDDMSEKWNAFKKKVKTAPGEIKETVDTINKYLTVCSLL